MKIVVETLKGTEFEIEVNPETSVEDVKKCIETMQGSKVYPAAQQIIIYNGKVLKDGTTMGENNVADNDFVIVMLTKARETDPPPSTVSNLRLRKLQL